MSLSVMVFLIFEGFEPDDSYIKKRCSSRCSFFSYTGWAKKKRPQTKCLRFPQKALNVITFTLFVFR